VGNARTKFGLFRAAPAGSGLPKPEKTLRLDNAGPLPARLAKWVAGIVAERAELPSPAAPLRAPTKGRSGKGDHRLRWYVASVNRPAAGRLVDWLRAYRGGDPLVLLAAGDLPLEVRVPRPDMVGVDRLLDALAANRLREPGRPAVVVDVGSAITVDLVSADGAFLGGAIMPGIAMSARAMHEFTDLLPWIDAAELRKPPAALGTGTEPAMRSGLYWGAVGGVRQLIEQLAPGEQPQVFLTGGAGPAVARRLGRSGQHVPHLTLAGIALAAGLGQRPPRPLR
jgi:type III pantothenate kinase